MDLLATRVGQKSIFFAFRKHIFGVFLHRFAKIFLNFAPERTCLDVKVRTLGRNMSGSVLSIVNARIFPVKCS